MTEVEFLRRELERQLKAVDDLNKMLKDLSQITFESKMDKWLKASKTKNEPVAWEQFHEHMAGPNYVAPQRTWVGLTDEEIDQGLLRSFYALQSAGAWREGVAWAMQQLKDKNNV